MLAKAVDARGELQIYAADELTLYEQGVIVATWFWRCVATVACIAVTIAWCAWRAAEKPTKKVVVRSVAVQGPVTYKRRWQSPRFHPLPEHDWGAWSD